MSNRQLGWDDKRVRDRNAPDELQDADREAFNQQAAEQEAEVNKDRVLDSNPNSHSKKD